MHYQIFRAAIVLGLMSLVGPLAINLYLPSLPAIAADLEASASQVQLSLMAFLAAVAFFQLIYGPVSDTVGRKPPLCFGLLVFIVGSIGCGFAPDIGWLIGFRFVQGMGACASMVLPRAIVRDHHTGANATRLTSLLMLIVSIAPITAPLAGSLIIQFGDWRLIFWVTMGAGVLALLLTILSLKETKPVAQVGRLSRPIRDYRMLLRDRNFLGLTFIGGVGMPSFMVLVGNSAFVFIEHYGLTPTQYSFALSVNSVSFFAVAQTTGAMVAHYGLSRVIRTAVQGFAVSMLALFTIFLAGIDSMWLLISLLFVAFGFLGLIIPTTTVLAMEEHGSRAGTASALIGTLQLVTGAAAMGAVGSFYDGTAMPMVIGFAACGAIIFILTQLTIRNEGEEGNSAGKQY